MAQPFDAGRAQIAGNAVPIAENVSVQYGGPSTPVTVSENSVLVYWTTGGAAVTNEMEWFDRAAPAGRKPIPFLQTDFSELQGQMSPDGHWMAYSSDESGSQEVYVRPFPAAEGKWRISTAGGIQPRWRAMVGNCSLWVRTERCMRLP
jgi:hypothetical protein